MNFYETYWVVTVFVSGVELLAGLHPSQAVCSSGHGQMLSAWWETGYALIGMASKIQCWSHCSVPCAKKA